MLVHLLSDTWGSFEGRISFRSFQHVKNRAFEIWAADNSEEHLHLKSPTENDQRRRLRRSQHDPVVKIPEEAFWLKFWRQISGKRSWFELTSIRKQKTGPEKSAQTDKNRKFRPNFQKFSRILDHQRTAKLQRTLHLKPPSLVLTLLA